MTPNTNGISTITPAEALEILELTPHDLVAMTGLGFDAIRRAVMGGNKRTNLGTADLIARALGVSVRELDWPSGLTHEGRPPLTGGSYTVHTETNDRYCSNPEHNLLLPLSGVCALCAA